MPELERNGHYLSVITTLPAAGPGSAARILLKAWSEHENALYSIDTDGHNLQRLSETLPCEREFGIRLLMIPCPTAVCALPDAQARSDVAVSDSSHTLCSSGILAHTR